MKKLLLLMLGVLIALPAMARDFTYTYEGQTITYTVLDEYAKTCRTKESSTIYPGNNVSGNLILPAHPMDGDTEYTLTEIGKLAFRYCSGLTSVNIPNSVKTISDMAFNGCSGLTSVNIPNSVQSIGESAFYGCSKLTSIDIPNSVKSIGKTAFSGCSGLTSVIIPPSVTSVGSLIFDKCPFLTKIAYPDGLSFSSNANVEIRYPAEGAVIENGWVYGPEKSAIYFAPISLEGQFPIPNSVTSIGEAAFSYCTRLTSVDIPNSIETISNKTFSNCTRLTSVEIPNSVKLIGNSAFRSCSGLTEVIIPPSVTSVGSEAFYGCSGLKKSAYPSLISKPISNGIVIGYPADGAIVENGWVYGPEKLAIYFAPHTLEGEYSIPGSVKAIGPSAFEGCAGLTSVTIGESVTSIGSQAFTGCSGLTSVSIGNSVNTIGNSAFYGCSGLTSIVIPNSVQIIGTSEFENCSSLTSVTIGESVTSIGSQAFYGCSSLTSVEIPNSVTSIGKSAFYGCSDLSSVSIGNSVQTISDYAFKGCSGLKDIIIADGTGLLTFGDRVFDGVSLESLYLGRNSTCPVVYNASKPFSNKNTLTKLTIGESVSDISEKLFYYCSGLTSVNIPNSVQSIGKSAFEGCAGLSSVSIGNSVESIGSSAFSGCSGLTSVKLLSETPPSLPSDGFDSSTYDKAVLDIPEGSLVNYLSTQWMNFKNMTVDESAIKRFTDNEIKYILFEKNKEAILVSGDYSAMTQVSIPERFTDDSDPDNPVRYYVTEIGPSAFYNCNNLEKVSFNSRIKLRTIGESAFFNCPKLSAISIPATVTEIKANAFAYCSSLKYADFASVEALCNIEFGNESANPLSYAKHLYINGEEVTEVAVPEGIEQLKYTFYNCKYLTSVTLPQSLLTIGEKSFYNCTGLTETSIPNSVESIGESAFYECTGLSSVSIGNSVESIGERSFYNCTNLTSIHIPNSVNTIGESAFSNCSGIKSLSIGNSVQTIGKSAFYNCSGLSSVEIPNSVESIGESAFFNCSGIKSLSIGNSVQTIGNSAFYKCSGLSSIEIPNSVESIGESAFSNCSGLSSIEIPNSVESIGESAFYNCSGLTSVSIPNSVKTIGKSAFSGCNRLKSVEIGSSIEAVDNSAFSRCSALTDFTFTESMLPLSINNDFIPSGITTLNINRPFTITFANFEKLTHLNIGSQVTEIPEGAFNGCTALEEVVLPPSVETIGASAFDGNSKMASIIMGHNVKTIGEKAFNNCPASTVSITAQTPPTAPNNTFSSYAGKLWLQDPGDNSVIDAYYDAYTCWDRFDSYAMIAPTGIETSGPTQITGEAGDKIQLTAKLMPENVTLPQVFWRSTNPAIATVDQNGLVTLHADKDTAIALAADGDQDAAPCKIIAESLYANGPICEVSVNVDASGIDEVIDNGTTNKGNDAIDFNSPYEVYNLNGIKVAGDIEGLAHGIYIVRQGMVTKKIAIK